MTNTPPNASAQASDVERAVIAALKAAQAAVTGFQKRVIDDGPGHCSIIFAEDQIAKMIAAAETQELWPGAENLE